MNIYVETDKDRPMNHFYLYPGSTGSGIFVPGDSPATVFLDPAYAEGFGGNTLHPGLAYLSSPVLQEEYELSTLLAARESAEQNVGTRNSARFFERVLSELFQEAVDIRHIMTGVTSFTGEYYHDFGYLVGTPTDQ